MCISFTQADWRLQAPDVVFPKLVSIFMGIKEKRTRNEVKWWIQSWTQCYKRGDTRKIGLAVNPAADGVVNSALHQNQVYQYSFSCLDMYVQH